MSNKLTLFDFGDVKIKKFDEENVTVEISVEVPAGEYTNPKTGKKVYRENSVKWGIYGYYPNIQTAIRSIYQNDLLIDEKQRTIEQYLAECELISKRLEGALK